MSTLARGSHSPVRARQHDRIAWSGLAVVVEAIVLLLFLVWSLSILTRLFAAAAARGRQGENLAAAISAATTCAERFAANPHGIEDVSEEEGLVIRCDVMPEQLETGTLYHATISVYPQASGATGPGEALYTLTTARYERRGN